MSAISLKHLLLFGPNEEHDAGGDGPAGNEAGGGEDSQLENSDAGEGGEGEGSDNGDEGDDGEGDVYGRRTAKEDGDGQRQRTQKTVTKVTPKTELTDERMAELAGHVFQKMSAVQHTREEPEKLTPEQIDKLLNPVRVTRESMAELLDIADPATISDKRIAAFQALLNATVKNSTSVSHMMLEQRMRAIMSEAAPMQEFIAEQRASQHKQAFFAKYPKLQKFGKFVQFAAGQVQPNKPNGTMKTGAEAMAEIASGVETMLKEAGVDINADNDGDESGEEQVSTRSNSNHRAGSGTVPRMASLQQPGRGSGPGGKGGSANDPDADIYK